MIYRQQYVRCGKRGCRRCPPQGPGHGPYWYGYYWDYRQRTKSFYVGKRLPADAEVVPEFGRSSTGRVTVALQEDTTKGKEDMGNIDLEATISTGGFSARQCGAMP